MSGKVVYGKDNVGFGMKVLPGGRVNVLSAPTITGAAGDLQFCGAATAIPPLVAGAVVPAAQALTTWAQWAANFGSRVMNYSNGAVLALN